MTRTARQILLSVLTFAFLYAVLRYHIFKGVEWSHFPLFILNKVFSFAGFMLLVISLALDPFFRHRSSHWLLSRKFIGRTGLVLIIMHIVMSFLLFKPVVYSKFFGADGNLNATGEWSMLFGTLGIAAYIVMNNSFSNGEEGNRFQAMVRSPGFGVAAISLSAIHVAIMGFEGWLTPQEWYGGMPSITMVSVFIYLVGMILLFAGMRRASKN